MLNLQFIYSRPPERGMRNDGENVRALKKGGIVNKALWILNLPSYR